MINPTLYVLGGGGHAKVVIDTLIASGTSVSGLIDPRMAVGSRLLDVPVMGGDELIHKLNPKTSFLANGVGATAKNRVNRKLFEVWSAQGFSFVSVIHPSAVIGAEVQLASACQIMAGAVIQPHVKIGTGTVINTSASVDHDCEVGAHCFISPKVTLCGGVQVGEGAFIGPGATLQPGVKVGRNVLIAAGAVISSDLADSEHIQVDFLHSDFFPKSSA